jgi:hypothetical protein
VDDEKRRAMYRTYWGIFNFEWYVKFHLRCCSPQNTSSRIPFSSPSFLEF